MKVVVTGVAGFIGSHIAEGLVQQGHEVIGIDNLSAGYEKNVPKEVLLYVNDVCDIEEYSSMLEGVDVVFHNAASKKNICMKSPSRDMEVNGIGTLKLLQECVKYKVGKFVHASTGSVYGEVEGEITEDTPRRPCSFYGISKMAGESYVLLFAKWLDITVLRYFHVYGSRQESNPDTGGVVAIFNDRIKRGQEITIHGSGDQKRVFTYVKDIVYANLEAWINPKASGKVYNCASSEQTSINELAKRLMIEHKKEVNVLYKEPLLGDVYNFNVNTDRIKELGIEFRPLTEIL